MMAVPNPALPPSGETNRRRPAQEASRGALARMRRRFFQRRTLWPTAEGAQFLLLMLGILLAAVNTGNNLIYLLLAMMLSIIILSGILSEQSLRKVMMSRRFPRHLFAGKPFQLVVRLENQKRYFSSFSLQLREIWAHPVPEIYFPRISPCSSATQRLTLTFRRRGRYVLSGIRLSTRFPFGLFSKTLYHSLVEEVLVYPRIYPLPASLIWGRPNLDAGAKVFNGTGSLFRNLRDYRLGDDSRAIHWKSSARQRRLMIREYETEGGNRVTLLLANVVDSGVEPERFENAVKLCASLAAYWIRQGAAVRLICAGEMLPFGTGTRHLHQILQMLALVSPCDHAIQPIPQITEIAYLIRVDPGEGIWPGNGPWRILQPEQLPVPEAEEE